MKSLTEKQVMGKFNKYKRKYISMLGKDATSGAQLLAIGKGVFKHKFKGVYPQDHQFKKSKRTEYSILNTDTSGGPGTHWVAVISTPSNVFYLYDSFGRTSRKVMPIFTKGKTVIDSDLDAEQHKKAETCGPHCLAFLSVAHEYGVRNALKI